MRMREALLVLACVTACGGEKSSSSQQKLESLPDGMWSAELVLDAEGNNAVEAVYDLTASPRAELDADIMRPSGAIDRVTITAHVSRPVISDGTMVAVSIVYQGDLGQPVGKSGIKLASGSGIYVLLGVYDKPGIPTGLVK
jgi:hypothetical protein